LRQWLKVRVARSLVVDAPSPGLVQQNTETTKDDEGAAYRPTYTQLVLCSSYVEVMTHTNDVPCIA
jgi:hypothetical protein